MARQGKGIELPTKLALNNAKCAAVKASQYLAGVFSNKSGKDIITPDLDALDASLVRIHKKSDVISVSSLAPTSPTVKDIQDRLQALSETFTIPNQSFAPPPIQESARDNLSVPTIRLRLSYEAITMKFAYLMDMED